MVHHVTDAELLEDQLWFDPSFPLHSIAKLLKKPDFCAKRAGGSSTDVIPASRTLTAVGRELRSLRASSVWKNGTRDEQVLHMNAWFRDIPTATLPANKKAKLRRTSSSSQDKLREDIAPYQTTSCPPSDIGTLIKLPGEIRNRIYRLATLQTGPIHVEMPYRTCGIGPCLHARVGYNVPGITQTCKQLRWEALPIYLAEHSAVQFGAGATHDGCSMRYLESLGDYADLIPKYTFVLQRPIWKRDTFEEYAIYHFSISTPKLDGSGEYSLEQWESAGRKICQCAVVKLVHRLNEGKKKGKPTGQAMLEFLDDEDFSDFVWRVRKTKQWPQHLAKCKQCKDTMFNS